MSSKSQRTIRKNKRRDEKTHQRRDFVSPRAMTATRSASHTAKRTANRDDDDDDGDGDRPGRDGGGGGGGGFTSLA